MKYRNFKTKRETVFSASGQTGGDGAIEPQRQRIEQRFHEAEPPALHKRFGITSNVIPLIRVAA